MGVGLTRPIYREADVGFVRTERGGQLSGAEAAELSRQIAGLAQAGLPLAHGLVALGEELPRGRLRRSMNELARHPRVGRHARPGPRKPEGADSPHLRGLVIAGLRSGGWATS